jgi:co-chaperonin GroES (HSP10)
MIEAIGTKLLVKRVEREQRSSGGIFITNQQDPSPRAEVVSIGLEAKEKAPQIEPGNQLIIAWANTAEIKDGDQSLYIVDLSSVYGVDHG